MGGDRREPTLCACARAGARARKGFFSENQCDWGFWSFGFGNPTAVLLYCLFLGEHFAEFQQFFGGLSILLYAVFRASDALTY